MAEGIIFGGYILNEQEFLSVFEDWYKEKHAQLKQDLQVKIINRIEQMIHISERMNSKGQTVASVRRVKGKYDAQQIYLAWESITRDYFGNDGVTLIAAAKFGNDSFMWTNNISESEVINASGINIRKKGLDELNNRMKDFESIYAAQDVQDFLNAHYQDLLRVLGSYTLDTQEALAMHALLEARKSVLNNADFSFTGATYDNIIFNSQRNAEGKRLDAFMNHVGQYNNQLFSAMKTNTLNAAQVRNLQLDDHSFEKIFPNYPRTQPWLLDSLNNTSWLSGGDIVVVNDQGAVIYNIQLKSTGKGKTFDVAASFLLSFAHDMIKLIDAEDPKALATLMYNRLKTNSANDFQRADDFLESQAYEMVRRNLNLDNIDLKVDLTKIF